MYIEKEKLLEDLRYLSTYNTPVPEWVIKKIEATNDLDLVRCNECKYKNRYFECVIGGVVYPEDDRYCPYGERMKET